MKNSTRTILAVLVMLLIMGTAPYTYSRGGPANEKCYTISGAITYLYVPSKPGPEDECYMVIGDAAKIYGIRYDYLLNHGIDELEVGDTVTVVARQRFGAYLACQITKHLDEGGAVTVVVRDCCDD